MSDLDDFYTNHWQEIEEERIERYEQMFVWREEQRQLLAPAELAPGQRVIDFGCGPGFMSRAIANLVAPGGHSYGLDINARFVADATARAEKDGVSNLSYHLLDGAGPPIDPGSIDRVICKNVLEYVPDVTSTLAGLQPLLRSGGRLHAIDSDWGFVIVEPWSKAEVDRFFEAAAPAFKEPFIGRKLPGVLADTGFTDIRVKVLTGADQSGRSLAVLKNMAGYIERFETLPADEIQSLLARAEAAVAEGRYLFCLPQFLVTGSRP